MDKRQRGEVAGGSSTCLQPEREAAGRLHAIAVRHQLGNLDPVRLVVQHHSHDKDPGLVARNVLAKFGLGLNAARDRFGLVLLLLPFALFIGSARSRWRRWLLILAPALLLSLPPSLLTMPQLEYQLGWLGVWGVLWLLLLCWAITTLPEAIRARLRARSDPTARPFFGQAVRSPAHGSRSDSWPWSRSSRTSSDRGRRDHVTVADLYRERASTLRPLARDAALARWSFSSALAKDWTPTEGVALTSVGDSVGVTTTTGRFDYQLTGPNVLLSPGRYELRADVTVSDGGIELGVLDADANAWLNTSRYWSGQRDSGPRPRRPVRAVEATPRAADPLELAVPRRAVLVARPQRLDPTNVTRSGALVGCRGS